MSWCGQSRTPHGTHVRYGQGCRCQDCRTAHAAYERFRRRAELARKAAS